MKSAGTVEGQDKSSLRAARILVNRGEYKDAIDVALASASRSGETEALTLVAHKAIEDGQFTYALSAASELYYPADQDSVELEVVCAIQDVISETFAAIDAPSYDQSIRFPSLDKMKEAAESGGTNQGEDRLLRKIAETAIILGNYDFAIEAGSASYYTDAQSDALTFVARCAAEEGLFLDALTAASKIKSREARARVTGDVMSAIAIAEYEPFSPVIDPPSTSCR